MGIMAGLAFTLLLCGCFMSWVYLIVISALAFFLLIPIVIAGQIHDNKEFIEELKSKVVVPQEGNSK